LEAANEASEPAKPAAARAKSAGAPQPSRKLSYKEQRSLEAQKQELAELPGRIERLEAEQHSLTHRMADPAFYQQESEEISRAAARLKELDEQLGQAYGRWEELEGK
jgi:ATP-binding cassette subfamily F protein uup